jgi:hypothetical protein
VLIPLSCSITGSAFSGIVNDTSCFYTANDNSGCGITDSLATSYGAAFASAGGGVFVTELSETGISIWFFARSAVPSAVSSAGDGGLDTRGLGTPSAFWANGGCEIEKYFGDQNLIFDITLVRLAVSL